MSARVSVTIEGDELLAVKTATTPEEQDDLAHEATRLRQAAHPGVVSLVEHRITPDRAELRTLFVGDSLEEWRGTVTRAAGLVAAVAATLADLHDDGIVHGRLDETHILVGPDGRPRVCGFSPAPEGATAADDVDALGRVFAVLLDRATTSDRRGAFRWPRAHVAERRALAQIVSHATDPVPERRPAARALARAILATTPDAELSFAPGRHTSEHDLAGLAPNPLAPDRTREVTTEWSVGPQPTPDDRATTVLGEQPGPVAQGPDLGRLGLPRPDEPDEPAGAAVDEVFGDQRTAGLDDVFVDRPWPTGSPATAAQPDKAWTVRVGTQRPRARARWRTPITISFLLLAVAAAGGSLSFADTPSDAGASGPPDAANGQPCAPAPPPVADVDGDGCPEAVTIADGVVQAGGRTWSVGDHEDAVVVGDWDCDGLATPAAYRPSTGDVFVFSEWAGSDEELVAESVARVGGGRGLAAEPREASGTNCDGLAVELANGERQPVEVTR